MGLTHQNDSCHFITSTFVGGKNKKNKWLRWKPFIHAFGPEVLFQAASALVEQRSTLGLKGVI